MNSKSSPDTASGSKWSRRRTNKPACYGPPMLSPPPRHPNERQWACALAKTLCRAAATRPAVLSGGHDAVPAYAGGDPGHNRPWAKRDAKR